MKRFVTMLKMEGRVTLSNRRALFLGLLLPVAVLLLWGYRGQDKMTQATFGSADKVASPGYLLVSMLSFAAITLGIFNYAPATAALRELGIPRRVRCTPLPTWQFLASRIAIQIGAIMASAATLTVVAIALFDVQLSWRTVPIGIGLLILTAALFLAIGQLIASVAGKQDTAQAASRLVGFVLLFAGTIALPVEGMPHALTRILPWTPGSVTVDLLRPVLLQGELGPRAALNLLVLVGYIVVAFALSVRFFRWDEAA